MVENSFPAEMGKKVVNVEAGHLGLVLGERRRGDQDARSMGLARSTSHSSCRKGGRGSPTRSEVIQGRMMRQIQPGEYVVE